MIQSPCNNICIMDPESGLCIGCSRTQKEINEWNMKNNEQRKELLIKIKSRQTKHKARL